MEYKITFAENTIKVLDISYNIILKTIRKQHFFKRKYLIYDKNDNLLLLFQKTDFILIFTKTKILINNLERNLDYKVKGLTYILKVNSDCIQFRGKVAGYLKSEFEMNGKSIGFINEQYKYPNNMITVSFPIDDTINKFCLILLIIATVNYWDPN
ncbi:hypothetical protein [Chryseobacterium sp. POE27]|uniref:hypothetical protein n=1 Tax=Chryseobacterium sp. POE27 TaxID=3138177 RepID=UPI003219D75D